MLRVSDYACGLRNDVYACQPVNQASLMAFRSLQLRLREAGAWLGSRGIKLTSIDAVPTDGAIGASAVLATQDILVRLHHVVPLPSVLQAVVSVDDPMRAIQRLAVCADEVANYIKNVLALYSTPVAIAAESAPASVTSDLTPSPAPSQQPMPMQPSVPRIAIPVAPASSSTMSIRKVIGIAVGVLGIGGVIALNAKVRSQNNPLRDRADLLPTEDDE